MQRALRHALLGVVLTVLGLGATYGTLVLASAVPALVPGAGTGDVLRSAVETGLPAVGILILLVASVGVGYREQRRHGAIEDYRRFVTTVGVGGVATVCLAVLTATVLWGTDPIPPAYSVTMALATVVSVSLVACAAVLAGVTLARLPTGRRSDARFGRPLAVPVGAAVVVALSGALDATTGLALATTNSVGLPAWLPQFGTVGMTVTVYSYVDGIASGLVLVGSGFALGIYAARRYGFDASVRRFVVLVTVGVTVLPLALAVVRVGGLWVGPVARGPLVVLALATFANAVVETGVVAVLAAVAGLGVAVFERERAGDGPPASSTTVETSADHEAPVRDREGNSKLSPTEEPSG